jgi:hypothetical protein
MREATPKTNIRVRTNNQQSVPQYAIQNRGDLANWVRLA